MLLATFLVGVLAGYWFGLRLGAWAAAATFVALLVAAFVPPLRVPLHILLAAGVALMCLVGPRRERPADSVRATRWLRATIVQLVSLLRSQTRDKRPDNDEER